MLRNIIKLNLVFIVFSVVFNPFLLDGVAQESEKLAIYYTNDLLGYLEPCG